MDYFVSDTVAEGKRNLDFDSRAISQKLTYILFVIKESSIVIQATVKRFES